MFRPHVVILGAGASRAAFPKGDANGKPLPLMADLVDALGLRTQLIEWDIDPDQGFEDVFSELYERNASTEIATLEAAVESYFRDMRLPEQPTIYDHLLLSLRENDLVASFNWDPLLVLAYRRNGAVARLPRVAFLHGNVATGYCAADRVKGYARGRCSRCGQPFQRVPLLYPIGRKDYASHEFIAAEWSELKANLKHAFMLTVFGYSAPKSDKEAIGAMSKAWGTPAKRNLEQTAFITLDSDVGRRWKRFIHSHHYEVQSDFYESWIANHPRRTGEAYFNQYFEVKFLHNNPIPRHADFPELWEWFRAFLPPEHEAELARSRH